MIILEILRSFDYAQDKFAQNDTGEYRISNKEFRIMKEKREGHARSVEQVNRRTGEKSVYSRRLPDSREGMSNLTIPKAFGFEAATQRE